MDLRNAVLGAGQRRRFLSHVAHLGLPPLPDGGEPVSSRALAGLPGPAARLMRCAGVVGRPPDRSFRVRMDGVFRLRENGSWLNCVAWQHNTARPVARVFDMRLDVGGVLPLFGSDTYVGGHGRMRGRVLGVVPVVDATGAELDIGELTTWLADAVVFAPSMLLRDEVTWSAVDDHAVDVTLTDAWHRVSARVRVDDDGAVVEVSSQDRWCDLPGGLVRACWSTPVAGWTTWRGRPVPTGGEAVWHLPDRDYLYARVVWRPETLEYDVQPSAAAGAA